MILGHDLGPENGKKNGDKCHAFFFFFFCHENLYNKPLVFNQSQRAYYLSYFIKSNKSVAKSNKTVPFEIYLGRASFTEVLTETVRLNFK